MPIRSVSQNRTWSVRREVRYAGISDADFAGAAAGPGAPVASGASERPGLSCEAAMNWRALVRDRAVMEQADVASGPREAAHRRFRKPPATTAKWRVAPVSQSRLGHRGHGGLSCDRELMCLLLPRLAC